MQSLNVLLIHNDPAVQERLDGCFRQAGFGFAYVGYGDGAVESARYLRPQVIILDVLLHEVDGFEVLRLMREVPELAETPVIFMTDVEDDRLALAAYDLGAYDYVSKDVNPNVLVAKVRSLLTRESARPVTSCYEIRPGMAFADRYEVVCELGRGNMGAVFLANHLGLGTQVALKALATQGPNPDVLRGRFEREARVLAGLGHPNVIRIHDAGWWGRVPYLVMDYVPGGTVADMLSAHGKLRPRRALEIALGVAEGMQHAHDHDILHRDLKAANILLAPSGQPVVTDFGLLLINRDEWQRLTEHGLVMGTPHYMSPEQIRTPNKIDRRSDVYSIGVMLYEMLTGKAPFHDLAPMDAMAAIPRMEVPSPRVLVPELPQAVELCCMGALAVDRQRRFQSARELAAAVRFALASLPRPSTV